MTVRGVAPVVADVIDPGVARELAVGCAAAGVAAPGRSPIVGKISERVRIVAARVVAEHRIECH